MLLIPASGKYRRGCESVEVSSYKGLHDDDGLHEDDPHDVLCLHVYGPLADALLLLVLCVDRYELFRKHYWVSIRKD